MVGRLFWVLARDDATPFSKYFSQVNERLSCPIPATILCAVFCTALGAIQLGSATAFNSLVGSFIILTTGSYLLAILPHLLTRRSKTPKGPFWMGDAGYVVNGIACALIIFFNIFFCFPYAYPVEPISAMNCESWNLTNNCAELIRKREQCYFGGRVFANSTLVACTLAGTLRRTQVD
jgi:choline transport protein